ncbi:hypothetical protein A4S06_08850 [Erysipelotrichaceae bacterium MTC7]|nr:hypothetical protein A4S06_08850 [Erysipelotrichaceae bacterium MTC7]
MKLIDEKLIKVNIELNNKKEVIKEFSNLLSINDRISNKELFEKDVIERESELSTSMGYGIAIPHTQSESVSETSLVFLKLSEAIDWDNDKVQMVLGIAVPYSKREEKHLKILSALARKLMNEEFREGLLNVTLPSEAMQYLSFLNLEIE